MIPRAHFVIAAAAWLVSSCSSAIQSQATPGADESAIRARISEMMAAENALDMSKALTFYTPDAVVQAPNRPSVKGLPAIRAMYETMAAPNRPKMEATILESTVSVSASRDWAWDHGTARTTVKLPTGEIAFLSKHLIVWQKVGGVWYVAGMSFSSDSPARQPTPAAATGN